MPGRLPIAAGESASGLSSLPFGISELIAAADVREFKPDHLLIAVRSGERSDWQERGLLDAIQGRFGLPMTVFSPA